MCSRIIFIALSLLGATLAGASDETLEWYLRFSELAVSGTVIGLDEPIPGDEEGEVATQQCRFRVDEVFKGPACEGRTLDLSLKLRRPVVSDAEFVLFLAPDGKGGWGSADEWFGAHAKLPAMIDALWRIRARAAEKEIKSKWEPLLHSAGVRSDHESLIGLLGKMRVPAGVDEEIAKLIKNLDADKFIDRQVAQRRLQELGSIPRPALLRLAEEGGPEAKNWAAGFLKRHEEGEMSHALLATFNTLSLRRWHGCTAELLGTLPHCTQRDLEVAARRTLLQLAKPKDLPLLRKSLGEGNQLVRRIVAPAYVRLIAEEQPADFEALLEDPFPQVRFATARALADRGDQRCLAPLIDLLQAESPELVERTAGILQLATGQDFAPDQLGAWNDWLAKDGTTTKLRFPIFSPDEIVIDGLVLHYTFSGGVAEKVHDHSGHGNHGLVHGKPAHADGVIGKAFSLDGNHDHIDTGVRLNHDPFSKGPETFCLWLKADPAKDRQLIPFGIQAPNTQRFYFGYDEQGDLGLGIGKSAWSRDGIGKAARLDTCWHHYLLTWDRTNAKLYIDGELVAQKAGATAPQGNLFVGRFNRAKEPEPFAWKGLIDDVRFYDRQLSVEEIKKLASLGPKS